MTRTTHHDPSVARRSLPRLVALAVFLAGSAVLTSCSTTEGFGKDVKSLGGGIEESAAKNKE